MLKKTGQARLFAILLAAFSLFVLAAVIAVSSGTIWPETGDKVKKKDSLTVDCSHMEDGYIMCKGKAGKNRLKLRIAYGDETFTYDLNNDGQYEVFPLQMGSGKYKISLYRNKSGKKYTQEGAVSIQAKLTREDAAYLMPNQYVNYEEDSSAVAISDRVCDGKKTDRDKFSAVCEYVENNFAYDFIRAVTVEAGALPDLETPFDKHMGICQDLAAITVCMLRVQGIPARLMIGYADKTYHAWVSATIDGEDVHYDPTVAVNALPKPKTYTLERFY